MNALPDISPRQNILHAAFWMIVSCGFLAILAGIVRYLAVEGIHPSLIIFFRLFFAAVSMLPWLFIAGIGALKTNRLKLYCIRATISIFAMSTWFWAVSMISIAEVTALSFLAPIFATIGAAFFLGETVRLRRWAATAIGFVGALIIIRPGFIELTTGSWLALAAAGFMGTSVLIIKTLTRTENPNKVVFYMGMMMTPVALIPALFVWETPALEYWLWIVAMGPVATFGHLTMVRSLSLADASAVIPFDFARLPFAVAVGWLMFGEIADIWTWFGATVIFASALYIARRESQMGKQIATPPIVD